MKVGRNEKCTCGSGLKYKKCCLIKEAVAKEEKKERLNKLLEGSRENRPMKLNPAVAAMIALAMTGGGK